MEKIATIDLASLDTRAGAEAGFSLELKHPETDAPIGILIELVGADSDAYQQKATQQQRDRLQRLAKRGMKAMGDPAEMQAQAIELIAAATTGWSGVYVKGEKVAFSTAAAEKLYRDFPWIREQVDEAIHNRANFLPRSATT